MENTAPQVNPAPPLKKFSPRTFILIGVLAAIAIVLIIVAIRMNASQPQQQTPETGMTEPTPTIEKTASIMFSPASLDLATSTSATVDIIVTVGNTPVTAVQSEIIYDPKTITNVKLLPPENASLFGPANSYITLFTDEDPVNGTLEFAIGIQPTGNPVVGSGSIGRLSFSVIKNAPTTQISFGPKTVVTVANVDESVLNTTTPLTLILQ